MSPVPGLPEKIAASLVMSLLKASAGIVRKRLSQSEVKKALEFAVASALGEALEGQELRDRNEDWEHYGSLLEDFFATEEVAFELAQLLDPRPDQVPNLATLANEFRMAGYVPETLPGFDLDGFLRAFFSEFYAAAGLQEPLRAGIDLKLLGTQLQQLGIAVSELRRAAEAGERTADSLERIEMVIGRFVAGKSEETELRRIVETARAEGFLAAYRTFEDIGSGLLKAGVDLGVDARGVLEIMPRSSEASRALPSARLEAVRLLAGELRSAVLDHSPSEDELNALEARYRQHIIRWFENLTFQGMMRAPKPIVLPLEEVYVELRAVAEVPEAADAFSVEERRLLLESDEKDETKRRELMSQLDAFRRERWSRTIPERKSMAEALHQRDRRAFVILGDPGSGKTTLLHFLALVYAKGPETAAQRLGVDLAEADRLPIFVPLAAFDDMLRESQREGRSLTLREFLPRYYDRRRGLPGLEPLFRRAFESGRALVLLDGLDEVLDVGTRTYVAQQAGALTGDLAGVRFAVSSRFVGYREAPLNLPTLSVLDFGMPEIETFVRRWAHAFEKWAANGIESPEMLRRAQTLEAGLMEDVRSNESVRRLAANPLMLTMLALLRRQVGRLPHRRVQLYESYVGTLLENWVDARSEGARERSVEILDQHQAESILIPLAFWLQKEKPSGTAGRAEIRNKLVEICLRERGIDPERAERAAIREAEVQADRFLHEMRQIAGLIIERGHDAFGFLHLTFQEYFAGRALVQLGDEDRWEAIRPNLHDPRWREPILLCAGRLGVAENRRPQVTQLVRKVLENEDPTEADLHRNLLLALAITCDDVNLETALVTDLIERATAQLATPINIFARELLRLLGQLVANGMASFDACLAPVEKLGNYHLRSIALQEWGHLVEVRAVEAWLYRQLDDEDERFAGRALDALSFRIKEDRALREKAIDWFGSRYGHRRESAARALFRVVQQLPIEIREVLLEKFTHPSIRKEDLAKGDVKALTKTAYENEQSHSQLHSLDSRGYEQPQATLERLKDRSCRVELAELPMLSEAMGTSKEFRQAILRWLEHQDNSIQKFALSALSKFVGTDNEARRAVLKRLRDQNYAIRQDALSALSGLVETDHKVRRAVLKRLRDQNYAVRQRALSALSGVVETDYKVRQAVLKRLRDQNYEVQQTALSVLSGIVGTGTEVRHVVLECLRNKNYAVRRAALSTLSGTVGVDEEVRQAVLERLRDQNYGVRQTALSALSGIVGTDKEARQIVLECLRDQNSAIRPTALSASSGIVGKDEEVRQAVLELLEDQNNIVQASALYALSVLVGTDTEVRQAVLERLRDQNYEVRKAALSALAGIVGTEEEVRQEVLERLKDQHHEVRLAALSGLSGIVGAYEEVRRAMLERLEDRFLRVRQAALSGLSRIVEADNGVRQAVLERLKDQNYTVRESALSALYGIVATDETVRRAALERLKDQRSEVRRLALSALSGVVGTSEEVRQAILESLGDESFEIRKQAVSTLSHLLAEAEVRQAILQRLDDQDFSVRLQVVEVVALSEESAYFEALSFRLRAWLGVDGSGKWLRSAQAQLAKRFGAQLPTDSSLRDDLLKRLREPRWSERLGASLAFLAWPGGPPDEVMTQVLTALEDRRGLEAYPAQLTAASYLINRNDTAAEAIDLCLEALDYGTQPWENLDKSPAVRRQAALVLGNLEPVSYDARIYDKLLHVLRNDEDPNVRDAAYGTLVRLARMREQQAVA